ncbi:MAG TPA: serine/threonine-protein kinase [Gemmatimonadaceae bacterium]|nr:serine/threonine-protein kinase [Gemmatimonadaceae bacterium]
MPSSARTDILAALRAALSGHFVVERMLGAGAMGTVVLARDLTLERPVAIKVINPELAANRTFRQRFLQEARTVARLRHHNLVTVYSAGEADGLLYTVMEFVPGESLRERLEREGRLPPAEAGRILHELADGLAAAHAQGVIHRDIKPENVLLDAETGRALLVDFGVAQALAAGDDRVTAVGMVMGSPRYMSPEQASGETALDGRSDLYTLGLVGYEMLAGRPPFTGPGVQTVLAQHITASPPPLAELAEDAPPALAAVIERALAKDPAARWPDARAMARALAIALGEPTSSGETQPAGTSATAAARGRWRRPALLAAAALVLAAPFAWRAAHRDGPPRGVDPLRSFFVAPFDVLSPDPSLAWLREGSVSMLALDLAQWTDLTVVDYERTLDLLRDAQLDTASQIRLSEALQLARASGVWSAVMGRITRAGDSLLTEASVYDVATGELVRTAHASVAADGDPRLMFDALARQLLEIAGAPPITPELARTTTTSITAFRAYLEGLRALNSWQLDRADSLFAAAVAADSTFALAHYKRALAHGWSHVPDSTDVAMVEGARRHAGRLPQRERDLVEGYLALVRGLAAAGTFDVARANGYLTSAEERYGALVARDSTDAESWYGLGDVHFHHAQLDSAVSRHWTQALRAFDRTLALDSTFHLAYAHKLIIYQAAGTEGYPFAVVGDSVLFLPTDSARRAFGATRLAAARTAARRAAVEQARHWVAQDPDAPQARTALADAYVAAGDFAQAVQTLRQAIDRPGTGTTDMRFRVAALEMAAGAKAPLATLRATLATYGTDSALAAADELERGMALQSAANVAAFAGARTELERVLALRERVDPLLHGSAMRTAPLTDAWRATLLLAMGADDTATRRDADRAIAALEQVKGEVGTQLRSQMVTLPFTAYLQRRDPRDLATVQRWLGREPPLELRTLSALAAGDTARADSLAAMLPPLDTTATMGIGSTLRQFARAEVHIARGDARAALRIYERLEPRQFAAGLALPDPRWPLYARSFLVRGQLHEQLGERDAAAAAYERFLELWKDADPSLDAQRQAARDGLRRVRGTGGGRRG